MGRVWRFGDALHDRREAIRTTLASLEPDVVGLQEAWHTPDATQADELAAELGMHAASAAPSCPPAPDPPEYPDQAGVEVDVGLLSPWPLDDIEIRRLLSAHRFPPAVLVARVARPAGRLPVVVATTEWEPAYRDDHVAQVRGARRHPRRGGGPRRPPRAPARRPQCRAGQPRAAAPRSRGDLYGVGGGGDPDAVTLSATVPFAPLRATRQIDRRIDHVLALPASQAAPIETLGAFVVDQPFDGVWPSDHVPVVVDVALPEAALR